MRVVSLVPSLTETLIQAGADVVGRTRYCVHPAEKVPVVPIVGGTKDLDWKKIKDLQPDLLVLDQEENLPWMKSEAPCRVHVFHATSIQVMPRELRGLAKFFEDEVRKKLEAQAEAWNGLLQDAPLLWMWDQVPGELRRAGPNRNRFDQVIYVIWKKPWMRVTRETFIGSVLENLGAADIQVSSSEKYPHFDPADFDPERTLLLLSSEPYPFGLKWDEQPELEKFTRVLVGGESFSWFGVRSFRFLSEHRARSSHHG